VSTSIKEALFQGRKQFSSTGIPVFEAELLLLRILKMDRIDLLSQDEKSLSGEELSNFQLWMQRRLKREPLSYITGERFFYKHQFKVSPDTFIPRPETEILVEECLSHLSTISNPNPCILDLCTGSGAVALSLASARPEVTLDAVDISPSALQVAQQNLFIHHLKHQINLYQGDLYHAIPEKKWYDVIVSNPPYIPSLRIPQLSPEVQSEPILALDGGKDGLDTIHRIIAVGPEWLKPGGMLIIEIDGIAQVEPIRKALRKVGFNPTICKNDLAGFPRVMGGYLQ
jgi:release factor glutamine methyltransferase